MTAARRARTAPQWTAAAARCFCARGLPRPALYGAPPRRDVIGWVAALLRSGLTPRWLALCAALRMRHAFGGDKPAQEEAMAAVAALVVEDVVLPLLPGESKRVLTTNVRRHVRRSAVAGLTFMHVFDFQLALFDLAEALHNSLVGVAAGGGAGGAAVVTPPMSATTSLAGGSPRSDLLCAPPGAEERPDGELGGGVLDVDDVLSGGGSELSEGTALVGTGDADAGEGEVGPTWTDVFALKFHFNVAVERFRTVCGAVGTRHVREMIERETCDYAWAAAHAAACGLNAGQVHVVNLVVRKGSSCEGEVALVRSHFTVFRENDPLVFAAELSTLDPQRAIVVADRHVGLTVRDTMVMSRGGTTIGISPGRSASNIRKLMYADALCARRDAGVISQSSFMHLAHKLTMLNSGLGEGTPGSTWAEPWPHWPPLEPTDKDVLEARAVRGNIVAGALLAATVLANRILGVGEVSASEHAAAMVSLREIAELGDAAAPSYIGLALAQQGPNQDIPESTRYYRMAVERGNKNAPAVLGRLLLQHGGDPVECADLFKLSIARGGRYGHRFLADLLREGAPGVPQDVEQACTLYEDAARLGDPVAKRRALAVTDGERIEASGG